MLCMLHVDCMYMLIYSYQTFWVFSLYINTEVKFYLLIKFVAADSLPEWVACEVIKNGINRELMIGNPEIFHMPLIMS